MSKIYLFSGPIQTGKTTRLIKWIKNKISVDGILQPVIDGKRHIKQISSNETRLLEISQDDIQNYITQIGNYKFRTDVFEWAQTQLLIAYNKNPAWLIIDEVGKLEMNGKGLEPAVSKIFKDFNKYSDINLVFVVRDYLVPQFLISYSLDKQNIHTLDL